MANTDRGRDQFYRIPNTSDDGDTADNADQSHDRQGTPSAQEQIDPAWASGRDIPTQEAVPESGPAERDGVEQASNRQSPGA